MKHVINWKKGILSSRYRLYSGEEFLGELTNHSFKQNAVGVIKNKKYVFITKGLFKQETRIMDGDSNKVLGRITYNSMMSKADIELSERMVSWKYDNGWHSRWSLFDEKGTLLKFAGGSSKGSIEFENEDLLLILTGLYVTNYYQQAMIAILVAVFIPIWLSLFT